MAGMPGVSSTMQMGPNGELQQPHSAGLVRTLTSLVPCDTCGVDTAVILALSFKIWERHSAKAETLWLQGMEMQGVLDGQQMSLHSGMLTNGMPVVPAMPVGIDGQQVCSCLESMPTR